MKRERIIVCNGKRRSILVELRINSSYLWEVRVIEENKIFGTQVLESFLTENKQKTLKKFYKLLNKENSYFEDLLKEFELKNKQLPVAVY